MNHKLLQGKEQIMGTKMVRKESKFARYMKGSVKILARARDFYVQSLMGCSGQGAYGSAMGMGCPAPQSLPRSFSGNSMSSNYSTSRDDDLRELIRIASTRSLAGKVDAAMKSSAVGGGGGAPVVTRSRTVAIGRIDEDKPCTEFGGVDHGGEKAELVYPRSKSCVASR